MVTSKRKSAPARKPASKGTKARVPKAAAKPPAPLKLPRAKTPVATAVRRDLRAIAEVDAELGGGALAEAAIVLARELDDVRTSGTAMKVLLAIAEEEDVERCHELARLALERIARESQVSAAEKASCARALGSTLEQIRALMPPERAGDAIDDLAKKRALRLAAGE